MQTVLIIHHAVSPNSARVSGIALKTNGKSLGSRRRQYTGKELFSYNFQCLVIDCHWQWPHNWLPVCPLLGNGSWCTAWRPEKGEGDNNSSKYNILQKQGIKILSHMEDSLKNYTSSLSWFRYSCTYEWWNMPSTSPRSHALNLELFHDGYWQNSGLL